MTKEYEKSQEELDLENFPLEADFESDEELEVDYRELVLTLEDESEINCLVISEFEVEDQGYIALLPLDDDNTPGDILLYRADLKEDETFDISMIETDEEFDIVSDAYYAEVGLTEDDLLHDHDHDHEHDHHHEDDNE